MTFINYWTRSSKISRFVGGEQINYLPMPKAEDYSLTKYHRLYLSLQLTSFIHKLYFLKNYLITSSSLIFLACKYCRKTLTAVLVAFLYSLSFFPVVNKTTRLLIVQENEPPLFTKSGGNAHAQTIICRWTTFLTNAHAQTIICTQLFVNSCSVSSSTPIRPTCC